MNKHFNQSEYNESLRRKIIGLGDGSGRKTYYLELQDRLLDVEHQKEELEENNRLMTKLLDDLTESERKYRGLVDNALVGIFRSDLNDRFLYVNEATVKLFGCESATELLSRPVSSRYVKPQDRQIFLDALKESGKLPYYEITIITPSGQQKTLAASAVLENGIISGVNVDITERKDLEEQLRQAQKMEAVGVLAGGIAHDFNNIMSVILGFTELLHMMLASDDRVKSYLGQIMKAVERASRLTHSLLAFSRKQVMTISEIDINDLIARLSNLLVRVIGEDIELRTVLQHQSAKIMADSGQIEQIIMNLATNARDAMPNGGTLTIVTRTEDIGPAFCATHDCDKPGRYAVISVSDTGVGMDEETRKRIFDPFFTTKEPGRGTGLGLAMVYGIVRQHNGMIDVTSTLGKGTVFHIYLPIVQNVSTDNLETDAPKKIVGGTETILVAEDDPTLRELSRMMLESYGYKVILAEDGEDAVSKYQELNDGIDLVILDMIMPKMSGLEAYKAIQKIRPHGKVVFLTGYTADKLQRTGFDSVDVEIITKPISQHDLLTIVRKVLG
ncbi:MAG TPA: ATP-binding protein [Dissulfurispiraceae bacterium]|nr:ATP-binding protein [Dissulfurispiraceae bacterium]